MVDQFSSHTLSRGQFSLCCTAATVATSASRVCGLTFLVGLIVFTCLLYSVSPVSHTFYLHLSWRYGNALAVLALHPTFSS